MWGGDRALKSARNPMMALNFCNLCDAAARRRARGKIVSVARDHKKRSGGSGDPGGPGGALGEVRREGVDAQEPPVASSAATRFIACAALE
jgi:hypothetical protein